MLGLVGAVISGGCRTGVPSLVPDGVGLDSWAHLNRDARALAHLHPLGRLLADDYSFRQR